MDAPNSNLHAFSGYGRMEGKQDRHIGLDNLLLRETVLRNTEMAVGLVLYSGYDTKIAQNMGPVEIKVSHVERKVNRIQAVLLLVLFLLSAACTLGFTLHHNQVHDRADLVFWVSQVGNHHIECTCVSIQPSSSSSPASFS